MSTDVTAAPISPTIYNFAETKINLAPVGSPSDNENKVSIASIGTQPLPALKLNDTGLAIHVNRLA